MDKIKTTHQLESPSNHQLTNKINNILGMSIALKSDETEKEENYLRNNLPNELLINIFKYLPHSDLQQIRLVCKQWQDLTLLPDLMGKSKLIINRCTVASIHNCLAKDHKLPRRLAYDTVEINEVEISDALQLILKSIAPTIQSVTISSSPIFPMLSDCLPNIEALTLFATSFDKSKNIFLIDVSKFKNVKSLYLDGGTSCSNKSIFLDLTREPSLKMEKLSLHLFGDLEEAILCTLEFHAKSLKYLELSVNSSPRMLEKWKEVFSLFTQIETLKISGSSCNQWLRDAIECLPKETNLRHCELGGGLKLDDELLKLIIHKWHDSLENMDLMFCNALTDDGVKHLGMLRHTLRSLYISRCNKISAKTLLDTFVEQKSTTLKTLCLANMLYMDPESVMLLAERLPNLTYLNLENCPDSVVDSSLAYIFRHQLKLQHLILNECIHISDEGLLGFGLNPAPISNLKGLQTLKLRGCRNISDRSLILGLKFHELRKLVLGYCHKISSTGIEKLVQNCPAIEKLTMSSCLMIDDDAVLHIAKGLRRLRCLNVSNCVKLTVKSVDYILELCQPLKDLCMCGIDAFQGEEVRERFLKQHNEVLMI